MKNIVKGRGETPYKIVDSALSPNMFKTLVEASEDRVEWRFLDSSAYSEDNVYDEGKDTYSWAGPVLMPNGPDYQLFATKDEGLLIQIKLLILSALDNAGEPINDLYRIRFGMHTFTGVAGVPEPHIDDPRPHKVGIIYLNDSDGDTIIYRNRYEGGVVDSSGEVPEGSSREQWHRYQEKGLVAELDTVTPKANRLLLFDGSLYHASSRPLNNSRRVILNFNYI